MADIRNKPFETHENRQKSQYTMLVYTLIALCIAVYIEETAVLFGPYIEDLLRGSDNKYSPKTVIIVNWLIVLAALFPFFWIVEKFIGKKYQTKAVVLNNGGKTEFSFSQGAVVSTVILDDLFMQVKTGYRKKTILLSRLRNYYLLNSVVYTTLYITYKDDNGKIKRSMMPGQAGNREVQLFNTELVKRFPDKSLKNYSRKEAFKILGIMSLGKKMLIGTIICVLFATAVVGLLLKSI